MSDNSIGTPAQLRDPDFTPPPMTAIPLGIQHVLAMFVSNVTPAIIVAGAAGFGFGSNSPDFPELLYMIQMSMVFAGLATLLQTFSIGPVGAKLPVVQGTSFAFLPIMIPLVAGKGVDGLAALFTGVIVGGIFHALLGTVIGRIRFALPPLVTGLVVTLIGLALVKVGIQYAAGGVPAVNQPEYGSLLNWSAAGIVILVTLGLKFFTRGMLSVSAVLIGLIVGYIYAIAIGMLPLGAIGTSWERAAVFALPQPFKYGIEFSGAAIIGFCLMAFVSAVETVGDVSGITKGGAGREATDKEIRGATFADGIGSALAGFFGGLPNTSFSQNVGLVAMTGVMSRHVVTYGAIFLIICGLIPKVGAIIRTIPIEVLGGGVIVMFGMVVAAGISMLSDVRWNRRNMVIFAIALSIGLGLQMEPKAVQYLPDTLRILMTSGLLPAAFIAIVLNLVLPEELSAESTEEVTGGLSGKGSGSLHGE
jgi:xanthine permease